MSYVITAENFLVNLLAQASESYITFKRLRCVKEVILRDIDVDIYIDITSLLSG